MAHKYRITVEISYSDGTEHTVLISLAAIVAYEIAHEKTFIDGYDGLHCKTWVTWRECQLSGIQVPVYEEWLKTVDRVMFIMPDPTIETEDG